jgi:hypothetical protein
MGIGEMSKEKFTTFLVDALKPGAASCRDGAIAFVCMDWRHMGELLAAGEHVFFRVEEPLRLEQDERGYGNILSLESMS